LADCPSRGTWACLTDSGTTRCNCLNDVACGADFTCQTPAMGHSFCRASF
jgi:hypothetical protein